MESIVNAKNIPTGTSGIYLIESPSGKTYVGQSVCLKRRLIDHKCPSRKHLSYPISKEFLNHDFKEFGFEILETCGVDGLNEKEAYWISKLKPCLNISSGGFAATGHVVSAGVREILSSYGKRQWDNKTDDEKQKIINLNLMGRKAGFKHSDEVRDKIRKTLTGRKQTKSVIEKRSKSMKVAMIGNKNGSKRVASYKDGELVEIFSSLIDAAKHVGISPTGISKVLSGNQASAGGFNWKLVE